jgi:hypothetical protein
VGLAIVIENDSIIAGWSKKCKDIRIIGSEFLFLFINMGVRASLRAPRVILQVLKLTSI